MKKRILLSLPAALVALSLASVPASAQQHAKFTLAELGGNVVGTWSGAIDLTQLGSGYDTPMGGILWNPGSFIAFSTPSSLGSAFAWVPTYNLGASTGPESSIFSGPLTNTSPSSSSGQGFAVTVGALNEFTVDKTYTTGTPLTSSATWNATTLAGLNLNLGTYVWNYGGNSSSVTLQVGGSGTTGGGGGVPEPGEWAAMGVLGAGLAGLVIRKRKKA
jgi:hypothetical protein